MHIGSKINLFLLKEKYHMLAYEYKKIMLEAEQNKWLKYTFIFYYLEILIQFIIKMSKQDWGTWLSPVYLR